MDIYVLLYAIQQGRNFTTPIKVLLGEVGFAVKKVLILSWLKCSTMVWLPSWKMVLTIRLSINTLIATNQKKEAIKSTDETTIVGLIKNNYKQLLQGLELPFTLLSFAIAMIIGVIFAWWAVASKQDTSCDSQVFVDGMWYPIDDRCSLHLLGYS